MTFFPRVDLEQLRAALRALSLDGWLLYDFHGSNPVARQVVGVGGMGTRRLFVWVPADGDPVAVAHRIELQPLEGFPGEIQPYAAWGELHRLLGGVVRGRRVAMEISPDDAVPYLDRVPYGLVQLIERLGGRVVPSDELVTRFAAGWSPSDVVAHRRAAETLAEIARSTMAEVVREVGTAREAAVQLRVAERIANAGLVTEDAPIIGFGPNAANPHYEPHDGTDALLAADQVVLIDLWGGMSHEVPFADQTWMGFAGGAVPDEVQRVWETVRDARDAVVTRLREGLAGGQAVTGATLDQAARSLIEARGYGDAFVHRTGHSIDRALHGSGPHLDSFETNDTRVLVGRIGFSVEPGVYLTGRFGVRSEVNVVLDDGRAEVTPAEIQRDLILPM